MRFSIEIPAHQQPRTREAIQRDIKRMASRAWWAGAIVGGILGLLVGLAIGYSQVGQTVVIPLSDGVRA